MNTIVVDARERQKDAGERFVSAASETGGILENIKKNVSKLQDDVHTAEDASISARPLARLIEKVDTNRDKLSGLEAEQKSIEGRLKDKGLTIEEKSDLKARSLVVAAEITSAKIAVAGDDSDLKRFGGYSAVKVTVDAATLNYKSAQEKLAETKSVISGFESGSLLNDPALLKKVVAGEIPSSQEIRKAAVEYLAAGAIVEAAESKARPLVMFSRDLQDGRSTSESLTASVDALQSFNSTQARTASAVVAYENAETIRGAVGIMEKTAPTLSGPQKERAEKDIEKGKESASVLSSNAIGELYAASAAGQRTGLASQVALEHYLFAKEAATSRSTGELMTDKEKAVVAAKEAEFATALAFLAPKTPSTEAPVPVQLDKFRDINDIQDSMQKLKNNEGNLALEAAKASFEAGALGQISGHLESAAEGLRELKREGKEGTAPTRLETGITIAQNTFVELGKSKTLDDAITKAGVADIGVQLASLGGKGAVSIPQIQFNLEKMAELQTSLNNLEERQHDFSEKKLELEKKLVGEEAKEFDAGRLAALEKKPEEKLSEGEKRELGVLRIQSELQGISYDQKKIESDIQVARREYETQKTGYDDSVDILRSLKDLTTAARDSEYLKTDADKAKAAEWVDKIVGTVREEGKPVETGGDLKVTSAAAKALTGVLSGQNLDNLSEGQKQQHFANVTKILDAIPQQTIPVEPSEPKAPASLPKGATKEEKAQFAELQKTYEAEHQNYETAKHEYEIAKQQVVEKLQSSKLVVQAVASVHDLTVRVSTENPDAVSHVQELSTSYAVAVAKGDEQARAELSSKIYGTQQVFSTHSIQQAEVLAKAPEHELQQWAERHSDKIEKSTEVYTAYQQYQAVIEKGAGTPEHDIKAAKYNFIAAVSQYVDDKAVDGFVKEQYVRQWTSGSHGQDVMQNVPDLQKAVQSFQSRTTNDIERDKHIDELYQQIHLADQPFREQRTMDLFRASPTEELRGFAEQHKEELVQDKPLAKAYHDLTIAQNTLEIARETYEKNPRKSSHDVVEKAEAKVEQERQD
ncbi:TPA: hypothetical protein HA238_05475, partial [Candidatus Micrarchaeota archaeon]|nr:hypothetical protein [Candidatus Micrarchaeota archaeon]